MRRVQTLCIWIITLLTFWGVWRFDWVTWDDPVLITQNPWLSLSFLEFLKVSWTQFYHGDFIPLTLLSFWIEKNVLGLGAGGQHLVNLLIHMFNIALLARILGRWQLGWWASYLVVLAFAVHPLQVESVAWLSERKGLLATSFILASILSFASGRSGRALVYWLVSLGFKGVGAFLPLLFIAWDRRIRPMHLVFALAFSGYAYLRFQAYGQGVEQLAEVTWSLQHWLAWPAQALTAVGFYIQSFVVPSRLSVVYPTYSQWSHWITSIIWALSAIGLFVWSGRGMSPYKNRLWMGAAWFVVFLLPVLHLVPRINFVNDRYMYLPIVGLTLAATVPLRLVVLPLALAATIYWPKTSNDQNQIWRSSLALWSAMAVRSPDQALVHNNLALELQRQGQTQEAERAYEKAVSLAQNQPALLSLALNNLGLLYTDRTKALDIFTRSAQVAPSKTDAFEPRYNRAVVLIELGRMDEARTDLESLKADLSQAEAKYQALNLKVEKQLEYLKQR